MQITFDTNDNLDELKKIYSIIQEAIEKRSESTEISRVKDTINLNNTLQQATLVQSQQQNKIRTAGGCKVIPYEDMSEKFSEIFSSMKIRY